MMSSWQKRMNRGLTGLHQMAGGKSSALNHFAAHPAATVRRQRDFSPGHAFSIKSHGLVSHPTSYTTSPIRIRPDAAHGFPSPAGSAGAYSVWIGGGAFAAPRRRDPHDQCGQGRTPFHLFFAILLGFSRNYKKLT
jgi:hypothetical protein